MAHNLDMTNNRANIAFLGSRGDIWHQLGQEMQPGMTVEQWAVEAGLNWTAIKVPAFANLAGEQWDHIPADSRFMPIPERNFICRSDSGKPLGYVSDSYQCVQPADVLAWFEKYISVDDRFELDVAGSLRGGQIIWATATFKEPMTVVGEAHKARLLMSTTFDGSGSTINKGTMTRVVCNNTLDAAMNDKRATIRTRHNTAFNADRVGRELAAVAESFEQYKAMATAMVAHDMAKTEIGNFFKDLLDIPRNAPRDEISSRKANQFLELGDCYGKTLAEGTQPNTAWAALNAVTRYVDHDKSVRAGDSSVIEARALSCNFGAGLAMKQKAYALLSGQTLELEAA